MNEGLDDHRLDSKEWRQENVAERLREIQDAKYAKIQKVQDDCFEKVEALEDDIEQIELRLAQIDPPMEIV